MAQRKQKDERMTLQQQSCVWIASKNRFDLCGGTNSFNYAHDSVLFYLVDNTLSIVLLQYSEHDVVDPSPWSGRLLVNDGSIAYSNLEWATHQNESLYPNSTLGPCLVASSVCIRLHHPVTP